MRGDALGQLQKAPQPTLLLLGKLFRDSADFLYKCTDYYAPEAGRTIRWDDPTLRIEWPLPAGVRPLLSAKDASGVAFKDAEYFP